MLYKRRLCALAHVNGNALLAGANNNPSSEKIGQDDYFLYVYFYYTNNKCYRYTSISRLGISRIFDKLDISASFFKIKQNICLDTLIQKTLF